MKRKQEVLMSIEEQYDDFMLTWTILKEWGTVDYELILFANSAKEEHRIIATAANKFWWLIVK